MSRVLIILASAVLLFFGLLHLHGTFFSEDLYPADTDLILRLKSSHIQMDPSGNLWKLWIGFNAMFSIGLVFIGTINIYLAAKHYEFLKHQLFLVMLTIGSNMFLVWVGYLYIITDFVIGMFIPLLLYITGFLLPRFLRVRTHN